MSAGRIAVTGVGMITSLGRTAAETFDRLVKGDRGFSEVTLFDTAGQRTKFAAQVPEFDVAEVIAGTASSRWSRSDALALAAARDALGALEASSIKDLAIAVGVTTGGMLEAEALLAHTGGGAAKARSSDALLSYPLSSTATRLAEYFETLGPVATICSACSSGANALVQGAAWLELGAAPRVLVGGTDALCMLTFTGFNALGATDAVPCRPFDAERAGLTLGEGAAFILLEHEEDAVRRGARVFAWLSGWAASAEAHHITQPEPSGRIPAQAICAALRRAGLGPADVDYVNAHGTGTVSNDAVETLALRAALGREVERVAVSSSKGQIGHTLGAAGAIEAAITILALDRGEAPPTGGLVRPADACLLNHIVGKSRRRELRTAISSSFGFGGTGTVLVFERKESPCRAREERPRSRVVLTGFATFGASGVKSGFACAGDAVLAPDPKLGTRLGVAPMDLLDPARSRRFDAHACLATAGAEAALRDAKLDATTMDVGLVVGTAFGNVERTVSFLRTAIDKGPRRAPPAEFPHLLPSAASGNASIYLRLSGPVLSTCDLEATAEAVLSRACDWIASGLGAALVAGNADPYDAIAADVISPPSEALSGYPRSEGAAWLVAESEASARARGATRLVLVEHRYEMPRKSLERARLVPPVDPAGALVIAARAPTPTLSVLERSGWGGVATRLTGPSTGFHEGATGSSLCAAAALVAKGEVREALVVGWNASRFFAFHLSRLE